jgi:hypothetical protein
MSLTEPEIREAFASLHARVHYAALMGWNASTALDQDDSSYHHHPTYQAQLNASRTLAGLTDNQ